MQAHIHIMHDQENITYLWTNTTQQRTKNSVTAEMCECVRLDMMLH